MTPLLEITGLRLRLGEFVLGAVSLALGPGDYLVLLGPSGCGKTTLLRAIAGIHPVGPGRLRLAGEDMAGVSPHRRRIGYVAQTADLFPHMNVARNVAFGLDYLPLAATEKRAAFERVVDRLRIRDLLARDTVTLSGGEGKLVALARSLVVGPRVLLLDEPLSGLHHTARTRMLDVLRLIHDELGTATVHVTHSRDEARAFGERCALMRDGRIEQAGSFEELRRRPATPFVAEFLGEDRDGA